MKCIVKITDRYFIYLTRLILILLYINICLLFYLGIIVYSTSKNILDDIKKDYTSIAVPNSNQLIEYLNYINKYSSQDKTEPFDLLNNIIEYGKGYTFLDNKKGFSGYIPSLTPDYYLNNIINFKTFANIAFLDVTCIDIKKIDHIKIGNQYEKITIYKFQINNKFILYGENLLSENIEIIVNSSESDLYPFQIKERYMIGGRYSTDTYVNGNRFYLFNYNQNPFIKKIEYNDSFAYFINEEWVKIIENCKKVFESIYIISTDNIYNIHYFNQSDFLITKGRIFNDNEYLKGENVCLLSDELAELNGINIGDVLDIEFFNSFDDMPIHNLDEVFMLDKKQYEVIGIYHISEQENDYVHEMSPNMVFIPTKSVSDIPVQIDRNYLKLSLLGTLTIENDYLEVFKSTIDKYGYKNLFTYFDKGYSYIKPSIAVAKMKIQLFSILFFIISLILLLIFLYIADYINKRNIYLETYYRKKKYSLIIISALVFMFALNIIIFINSLHDIVIKIAFSELINEFKLNINFNNSFNDESTNRINKDILCIIIIYNVLITLLTTKMKDLLKQRFKKERITIIKLK